MTDVTQILSAIQQGDRAAAGQLLPLVYEELRKLAAARLAREKPDQTLQATALVHEAYLRLVGDGRSEPGWDSRGHFFAAAAEAMRRILVENARRHASLKGGGGAKRVELAEQTIACDDHPLDLLALDEALRLLEQHDPDAARFVKLRFFAGLGHQEAADAMGLGRRAADRLWTLARTWLYRPGLRRGRLRQSRRHVALGRRLYPDTRSHAVAALMRGAPGAVDPGACRQDRTDPATPRRVLCAPPVMSLSVLKMGHPPRTILP